MRSINYNSLTQDKYFHGIKNEQNALTAIETWNVATIRAKWFNNVSGFIKLPQICLTGFNPFRMIAAHA